MTETDKGTQNLNTTTTNISGINPLLYMYVLLHLEIRVDPDEMGKAVCAKLRRTDGQIR